MIEYYEQLSTEEKEEVNHSVRLLYKQTFILERKYEKRTSRMQFNKDYRACNKHLAFIKEYFQILGIEVCQESANGIIYLQGENLVGDKVPRLTTLYLLIMKLIYDEQMSSASTNNQVITTVSELHEKLAGFRLLNRQPPATEVRRSFAFLKKYQVIEPVDILEELEGSSRIMIYPSIHMVLMGDDIRALLDTFKETEEEDGESEPEI